MPISNAYSHVRLTVTDIGRSRAFYEQVFGMPVALEVPEGADEATREQLSFLFGGVIYRVGAALFGLRPAAPSGDRFDENRVGLDHLAFLVDGVADLENIARSLDELGVAHAGVKDIGLAHILEFRDPDNIALELYAWKPGRPPFES
ncbi:MAG: glyoxylase family protein [Pseudonocardiales bacterium]|jgi:catechol 2,3-dioxygenase-like lactoylglutathione lyase family enzyme|nr:glyoxylase family protein [Pseudonocardiales bacterium]